MLVTDASVGRVLGGAARTTSNNNSRIRELILELLSEVHFLGHDFERFEIMA